MLPYNHSTGAPLLSILGALNTPLGALVRVFRGAHAPATQTDWLDEWFRSQLATVEPGAPDTQEVDAGVSAQLKAQLEVPPPQVTAPVRLLGLRVHYFRGFRKSEESVNLSAQLIVVEGRNSSGKTSLAEALEWLFSGQLQRRLDQEQGNPQELADCIQSQLRPEGEVTYVEAVLQLGDQAPRKLRRVLVSDYGSNSTSRCESTVFLDGKEISPAEEAEFMAAHFAGVAPLLMQHTLREFVHSTPTKRRVYFESLLSMNEVTALIERAVVGEAHLKDFPSPSGSVQLQPWHKAVEASTNARVRKLVRNAAAAPTREVVSDALIELVRETAPTHAPADATLATVAESLRAEQQRVRELQFPLLKEISPKRLLDTAALAALNDGDLSNALDTFSTACEAAIAARHAMTLVADADRLLAGPIATMIKSGLLHDHDEAQSCPLCQAPDSLNGSRVQGLISVEPVAKALVEAEKRRAEAFETLRRRVSERTKLIEGLVPSLPSNEKWDTAIAAAAPSLSASARQARAALEGVARRIEPLRKAARALDEIVTTDAAESSALPADLQPHVRLLSAEGATVAQLTGEVRDAVSLVESKAAASATDSGAYAARAVWLQLLESTDELVADLRWESSKRSGQARLQRVRESLMLIRQIVLESRRKAFSDMMGEVWGSLRSDPYARFKDLHIPPPSGRGFPVAIQVRATLSTAEHTVDVDALRVFSESQVHVLGIAAFVTRSTLLGHSLVVFDDPVQSMDEEHFKTFAHGLLPALLAKGWQVLVLTHNDTFARDLSWAHAERPEYATLSLRHSRRDGCKVDEGSRRVTERLKRAEKLAENGDLPNAWRLVRLALERLYTLVKRSLDAKFDTETWRGASAEEMWNAGVGAVVENATPGSGKELKRILDETAAGAHDKPPRGETDLLTAVKYVRGLLVPLRIGG